MSEDLRDYIREAQKAIRGMPLDPVEEFVQVLRDAWKAGRSVFVFGNGGSSATASHFTNDLNKTAIVNGHGRFRAIALTDNVPLITAWANDASYDDVFAEQMLNFIRRGDVVVGISTSGNSKNVIRAIQLARSAGALTVGLTGLTGGKLVKAADLCISVPTDDVLQIEGIHSVLLHAIVYRFLQLIREEESTTNLSLTTKLNGPRPAIFVDRDGVINENRQDYVKSWEEFVFLPNVLGALKALRTNPRAIVVVSNQSAIGRGITSRSTVERIHERMLDVIHAHGGRIDAVYYCPHDPADGCDCRKPRPGLLVQAAQHLDLDLQRSVVIGDAMSDIEAALAVGCTPILVLTGRGRETLPGLVASGYDEVIVVHSLEQAVALVPTLEQAPRGAVSQDIKVHSSVAV